MTWHTKAINRFTYTLLLLAAPLVMAATSRASACPPATSISVAVSPTYTFGGSSVSSAVYPDSSAAYVDGSAGVSAYINGCTHDAILDLGRSTTRAIGLSFQNAVAQNTSTPSWTSTPFLAKPHIVVSNIMYIYSATTSYSFTTTADINFTAPDGSSDQLQFVNPAAQASSVQGGLLNYPYNTSLVVVTHIPASMNGGVEAWTVTPDNSNMNPAGTPSATQVGGLLVPAGRNKSANGGQFSMPFQFTITLK